MKYLLVVLLASLSACASFPRHVDIASDYGHGISMLRTPELETLNQPVKIGDICIEASSQIDVIQPIEPHTGVDPFLEFSLNELVPLINEINQCSGNSRIINLDKIKVILFSYTRIRYNIFRPKILISGNYTCHSNQYNYEIRLENFSFIGDKKTDVLVSGAVVLAFHQAVEKVFNQMKGKCQ